MERVVEHKDEWTLKANELSLEELCTVIRENLEAHGYTTDDAIKEILSYVRVFYERYNANIARCMVPGGSVEKADAAWLAQTPLSEERA
jgi:sulfur relay (sulfurtransferase) DsrC/TusE family protein